MVSKPSHGESNWDTTLNAALDALDTAITTESATRASGDTTNATALTTHKSSGDHDSRNDGRYSALGHTHPGGTALPSGIVSTDGQTAVAGLTLNTAEATTGWTRSGQNTGPTLDNTVFNVGSGSVKFQLQTTASTNKGYVDLAADQALGGRRYVLVDIRYARVSGSTATIDQTTRLKVGSAITLGGTVAVASLPQMPESKFVTVAVDVSALPNVRSIGIVTDGGTLETSGKAHDYWLDNVRLASVTELDAALDTSSTIAVLVPPSYVASQTQDTRPTSTSKTVLDTRPGKELFTRHGGVRHIREWGIPDDGLTEVSALITQAATSLSFGETLRFSPNGKYWVDTPIRVASGTTLDFDGATLFTRLFRGGDNNVQDPVVYITGVTNVTLRNGHVYGYHDRTTTGSGLTNDGGSPTTVTTTKTLTASGDTVRAANNTTGNSFVAYYARHPLVMFPSATRTLITATYPTFAYGNAFVATLSDTNHVASDCVLELVAADTAATVLASRTLTLTGTPTDYVIAYTPTDDRRNFKVRVRKATATANTITVTQLVEYGLTDYSATHDSANAIEVINAQDVLLDGMHVEGAATDSVDCTDASNARVTVRNLYSRCANRQGISFNYGRDYTLDGAEIIAPARSGIDVEPFATNWYVKGLTIRDVTVYAPVNYALTCNNWASIERLQVDGFRWFSAGVGGILGGARGGTLSNIHGQSTWDYGPTPSGLAITLNGQDCILSDFVVDGTVTVGSSTSQYDPGTGVATYTPDRNRLTNGSCTQVKTGTAGFDNQVVDVIAPGTTRLGGQSTVAIAGGDITSDITLAGVTPLAGSSFPRSVKGPAYSAAPFVPGGMNLLDNGLIGVRALGGVASRNVTLHAASVVASGNGSSVDLTTRGRHGVMVANCSALTGTITFRLEVSQDNTNWYTALTCPTLSQTDVPVFLRVRGLERYVRVAWTMTGTATVQATLDYYGLPGVNLGGVALPVTSTSTSLAVTFGSQAGPTFQNTSVAATTGGSLTPSTTYYYRIGARTRVHGPSSFDTERSVALGGAQNAVQFSLNRFFNNSVNGYKAEGFTLLRGTVSGTYTQRFDVLPKTGIEDFQYRHNTSFWTDLGGSITPDTSFTGFPTTYPTGSPTLTINDESGWEPDANYGVIVTPNWGTTCYVTAKTRAGFTVNFGTAAPGAQTIDYLIVR